MNNLFQWQPDKIETLSYRELAKIDFCLHLIFLALKAITNLDSDAVIQAAKNFNLDRIVKERITLWQLKSNSTNRTSEGVKNINVEEVRSLIIVICYLSRRHQELLREAVNLLEQTIRQNNPLHKTVLLGKYFENFANYNRERINLSSDIDPKKLSSLAGKLLIDLLFYSSHNGHNLLWFAMLKATQEDCN